ncbi:MFS transporter [Microaceticoccus formicicus]|uniref:MFS transporter n=1 Tax=Microaceticoccus formicicus TaxID=3118105 RepID=UPI003CCFFD94|nr:MFS transporter [Peptoniphilaceae bacterium AMB_02]
MLKNYDFLLLLLGRFITNFGDSIYTIATMSLVYNMTGSTLYTGLALFLTSIMGIFQLILSPILDRINMKRFLILSQLCQGILLLIIPLLKIMGALEVYHVLIIMPIVSFINQLVYPGQLSLLPKIMDESKLIAANSLFSIAYQGTDAIFNALSGVVILAYGLMSAYYIDSATFFINSFLFLFLSRAVSEVNSSSSSKNENLISSHFSRLKSGLKLWKNEILFPLLLGVIIINFAASGIYSILPAYSENELYYSLFLSASGIGILLGSFIANLGYVKKIKLGKVYIYGIALAGLAWMGMSLFDSMHASNSIITILLFTAGWVFIGMLNIYSQTIVQLMIPKESVAGAMGGMIGLSVALAPLGALLGGFLGKYFILTDVIKFFGVLIMLVSCYWMLQGALKKMGSLNEVQAERISEAR